MEYNITKIASIIGADFRARNNDTITSLLTDSRSLLEPNGTLFFALRTPSGDGHRYISQLYQRGVRNFVVEQVPENADTMPEANFLVAESPLEALQTIATHCRHESKATVIAITGSRGKTTVKEWICRLISPDILTVRSPRSFNSQTGVPLSLWQLTPDTEAAIIEAGISQPGEMTRLEKIIEPRIGIFTNIGAAHSRDFGAIEEKCREKALLMKRCSHVVYCADN
ncbi:MAG: bifunctional UDP-N-acetylmuramoyl-tripeptide:D-alanyl-D-alanine ligase/alanine racemase, partial [Duncaniella sp.]|nr:bifunctional UDP-N-acetylmuramoyl-tripeptide:D-alanyl-D-alanine ligase/alanine racemase [Duncaniella sp.]